MEQQYSVQVQQSSQQQPRRSSPRDESNATINHHSGHIMQSRSSSQSHGVSKKSRSRSRGKRRPQQQQSSQHQQYQQQAVRHNDGMINSSISGRRTPQDFHDSNNKFSESESSQQIMKRSTSLGNMSASNILIDDTKINEFGRCIRHPNIELCCRDTPQSPWRMLLQDCPLCSLDMDSQTQTTGSGAGGLSSLYNHQGNNNKVVHDGGNSSQPSTKTARTLTTEEDNSSVKSWTMSDASDVSSKSGGNRRSSVESEQLINLARNHPPPPPKQMQGNPYLQQQQHQKYQLQQQRQQNPVQSLKELGRKLVMESEVAAGAGDDVSMRSASTRNGRRPPPPPPRARGQQQRVGPPPRRRGRSASGGVDESNIGNNSVLGEPDELLARMQSLTTQEGGGVDMASEEERAAADKRARAQRRKEKAERKARKQQQSQQEQQMMRQEGRGRHIGTFEIPMNDMPTRGRDGRTDDILQAAAQIRARARRSTSRSRERVKEAAIFCGESLPVEDDTNEGGQFLLEDGCQQGQQLLLQDGRQQQRSQSAEKKRSILNPHGLEDQPRPLAIERRSQSRERRKKSSRGRRRSTRENGGLGQQQQQTTAEELLSRRREMRQKIAERQSNAQSRIEHRRTSSGGRGRGELTDNDNDSLGWTRTQSTDIGSVASRRSSRRGRETDDKSERSSRRGRSRSAVRDGLSKIRSASLNAFRNKKEIGIDLDDEENYTVDTGKRSTSSFKRMLSKGKSKPRSLSGPRKEWGGISEPNIDRHGMSFNTSYEQGFESDLATTKSESFTRQSSSSSRFGMFKKSLSKKKPKGGGMVRSLSRGNFRDSDLQSAATFTEKWEERSGTSRSEMFPNVAAWELSGSSQSMRSASSGRQRPRIHEFLDF